MNKKIKLLIIGSSQGVYGGIEAFMLAIADAAAQWTEFEISLCYKLVEGYAWNTELKEMLYDKPYKVYFVEKASKELFSLIKDADVLHIQNMPPDIVLPAFIRRKKIFLTIHNRKMSGNYLRYKVWTFCSQLATERWYNSSFVHQSWEGPLLKKIVKLFLPFARYLKLLQILRIEVVSYLLEGGLKIKELKRL